MINRDLARKIRLTPGEVLVPTHACGRDVSVRAHKGDLIALLNNHSDEEWWSIRDCYEGERNWLNQMTLQEAT